MSKIHRICSPSLIALVTLLPPMLNECDGEGEGPWATRTSYRFKPSTEIVTTPPDRAAFLKATKNLKLLGRN
jgi:hypothetical protein